MAVDAGLNNLALPIEFGFEVALVVGDEGDLEGGFEGDGEGLLVCERGFVGRIVFVKKEGGGEGGFESGAGGVGGFFLVFPGTEATIGGAVGIEDEGGEGEVVVELEAGEVE